MLPFPVINSQSEMNTQQCGGNDNDNNKNDNDNKKKGKILLSFESDIKKKVVRKGRRKWRRRKEADEEKIGNLWALVRPLAGDECDESICLGSRPFSMSQRS